MRKMKGVASGSFVDYSSPYLYATVFEDTRTKFKYQSLIQDYEELHKETEAKKMKLQMMEQKKSTLLAEVGFLRRRYRDLVENQSQNPRPDRNHLQLVSGSKNARKEKNYGRYDGASCAPVPQFNMNQEGKVSNKKNLTMQNPTPLRHLNQKRKTWVRKEVPLRNSVNLPDLNVKERVDSVKEATVRTSFPIFDLNQISMEEEELECIGNTVRIEDFKITATIAGGSDQQHNDIKLSSCRNGSSGSGKRKVSWQDQVVLRV